MPDANKMITLFTQEDVNYVPVSTAKGKACSACRFFCDDMCHIVYGEIAPNGYCDRYETVPPPPPAPDVAPIPVMIVEAPEMEMEMSLKAEEGLFNRILDKVKAAINPPQPDGAFTVQKDLNGAWRWIATFSNNFMDREGEIISEKAWDNYLERVNTKLVPMPELWLGHIEGTKHGVADMVFGLGNFVTAVGHFDSPKIGKQSADYARKYAAQTSLSHGFTFPEWGLKDGVYDVANPFEVSILPPPLVASNPYTEFEVNNMKQITPEQEAASVLYFGKEKWEQIKANRLQQSEELKAAGRAFKDFVELNEEAPAETPPADALKPMGELIAELIESQGELLSVLTAQGKALKAYQDAQATKEADTAKVLAAVVSTTEKLAAELKLSPRAASSASETKLSADDAKEFKQQLEATEADSFFSI